MLSLIPTTFWQSLPIQDDLPVEAGKQFPITDTVSQAVSGTPEGCRVIQQLLWKGQNFVARCDAATGGGDLSVAFPSPLPQGRATWDRVHMDWHIARDQQRRFINAPAVLILDILQGGNLVSGYIAKTLVRNGIHGFVMHMPQNGQRRGAGESHDWSAFIPSLRQAAGDARRARDVIAAMPLVNGPISLQGTSLGGFVATLAAAIDPAFHTVCLALTGGDVFGVLRHGKMDAARVRRQLLNAGYDDERLRDCLWQIEPLRVASRLNPKRTWLFSARFDQVIPRGHEKQLAAAIGLDWQHHRQLAGCHYTCALGARRFLSELVGLLPKNTIAKRPHYAKAGSFNTPALA